MKPEPINPDPIIPRWSGRRVVVAAPGPSLTEAVAERCRSYTVLAIKEAYRRLPWAEVLYGCDGKFWDRRDGCRDFQGERWSSHGGHNVDNKQAWARKYGLNLVRGRGGDSFSLDPAHIHYGSNSGFQAINLAMLFCGVPFVPADIVLVGFDMRADNGNAYFFGNHPTRKQIPYDKFAPRFVRAAQSLPKHIRIVNATPGSALTCFPMMSLEDALNADPVAA
jgi:hypothetical protein